MLEILNLNKKINEEKVINDLNLVINNKSIFGLFGDGCSEKTSILRMISNSYSYDSGKILIDGEEIIKESVRKDLLYIPREFSINEFHNPISLYKFYSCFYDIDNEKFKYYLNIFKVDPRGSFRSFSTSMKKITLFALAFSIAPKLLLIDECFEGVDFIGVELFKQELLKLIENKEMIVILTSNSPNEYINFVSHFGLVYGGKLIYQGEVKNDEKFYKISVNFQDNKYQNEFNGINVIKLIEKQNYQELIVSGNREQIETHLNSLDIIDFQIKEISIKEFLMYGLGASYE